MRGSKYHEHLQYIAQSSFIVKQSPGHIVCVCVCHLSIHAPCPESLMLLQLLLVEVRLHPVAHWSLATPCPNLP